MKVFGQAMLSCFFKEFSRKLKPVEPLEPAERKESNPSSGWVQTISDNQKMFQEFFPK